MLPSQSCWSNKSQVTLLAAGCWLLAARLARWVSVFLGPLPAVPHFYLMRQCGWEIIPWVERWGFLGFLGSWKGARAPGSRDLFGAALPRRYSRVPRGNQQTVFLLETFSDGPGGSDGPNDPCG